MRNVWPQPRAECSGNEPRPADSPWLGGWASGVPEPVSLLPNFSPQLLNQRRREDKIPSCVWSSSDYRCLTLTRMHTEHNSWGSQPVEVLVVFQGSFKVHCSFSMGWVLIDLLSSLSQTLPHMLLTPQLLQVEMCRWDASGCFFFFIPHPPPYLSSCPVKKCTFLSCYLPNNFWAYGIRSERLIPCRGS